jgi:predicted nucleic acid-binding Zn ribbon protein
VTSRGPDDAAVPRIDEPLGRIRRELGMGEVAEIDLVAAEWEELVGPALAAHCRPRSVRAGVLRIVVDSPAWAGQLRYLDDVLVARITESLPAVDVREVRVTVSSDPPDRA